MWRPLPILLLLLAACGDDAREIDRRPPPADTTPQGQGEGGGDRAGPLANAGPDQRALPGMVVRLDGRGTLPPEDARPHTLRWLQASGPGAHLSDPTSPVVEFVAPQILPGSGDRLVFLLEASDGSRSSRDRVVVELVEDPAALAHPPVAVAGADIEATHGEEVSLPAPSFLDPSCLGLEDREACLGRPLPHCWTQVRGPAVELRGACGEEPTTFEAPPEDALLVFRLDAHAQGPRTAAGACGPEASWEPTPLCATPDYLRVVVRATPRRGEVPPHTWWRLGNEEQERVGMIELVQPALEVPKSLEITAGARDEADRWKALTFFRPILGWVDGPLQGNQLRLHAPPWPGPVAVALEAHLYTHRTEAGQTRIEWFHGAPPLALINWGAPTDLPLPAADAGPLPCGPDPEDPARCPPVEPGQEVVLEGSFGGQGVGGTPQTCWTQTYGPKVELLPGDGCLPDQGTRRFIAPTPPGDEPLELAFVFTVQDAGPYSSRPSALWVQVRPEGVAPPLLELDAPAALAPGASAVVDASRSLDPEGGPLRFRWRQPAGHQVGIGGCEGPLGAATSCVVVTAPLDAAGSITLLVEAASQASGLVTRREVEIPLIAEEEPP